MCRCLYQKLCLEIQKNDQEKNGQLHLDQMIDLPHTFPSPLILKIIMINFIVYKNVGVLDIDLIQQMLATELSKAM
jgi:hypothetical protein